MRLPSLLFFILLSSAPQAFASLLPVSISTTGFSPISFYADSFWLDSYSGTVVLDSTTPVTATINNAHFSVAQGPYPFDQTPFPLDRMLTVDSVTQAVTQPAAMHLTFLADDVTGYLPSGPTAFNLGLDGLVDVTLNYFLKNAFDVGLYNFDVTATFAWTPLSNPGTPSVPEPATLALLGIGIVGLALLKRNYSRA